jgi:transcriptional regulator with XRE-family HTH domain
VAIDANALGDYLRARRELVDPADVGLPTLRHRRTPGLRREEVAALAGISVEYYIRLEQGRDRNPSAQVLQTLADALALDTVARNYLTGLASPAALKPRRRRTRAVSADVKQLIDMLNLPAFVESHTFDVLAANRLATALSPCIRPGENRLRSVFLDERERRLHPDWNRTAAAIVASFRASVGSDPDDPRAAQIVGELSMNNQRFRQLWARHDVRTLGGAAAPLTHPIVGPLHLRRQKLPIAESNGQILVIYHAEPGSDSAASLGLLGSLAATDAADQSDRPTPGQAAPAPRDASGPARGQ